MFIVGIEPRAPGLHIFSGARLPRLGLPLLFTMAQAMGHQGEIYCEDIAPIDWERVRQADIICISSITSTIPRTYEFIRKIRQELKLTTPILIGGPHVTFLPDEALDHGADYAFRHEADHSFPTWLQWWTSGRDPRGLFDIPDLSFRVGNQNHHNTADHTRQWVDLDTLPTPDLRLIVGYDKPSTLPLITSRGCPFNCDFCSEYAMFGRRYRFRSESRIINDLEFYDRIYGTTPVFIADDNAAANPARLEELCTSIVNNGLVRQFSCQVRLDLGKRPRTIAQMIQAGVNRAFIGYESVNQLSLDAAGKKLKSEEMRSLTKVFHRYGIAIHAMWILGFDDDTIDTVKQTIRSCIRWGIETSQFLILVPIPGAPLYQRFVKQRRIIVRDWAKYDGHHVTFKPMGMTARQLQIAVMLDAMPRVYNHWQTYKLLWRNNLQLAWGVLTRKVKHPLINLKGNIETFFARLGGRRAIVKIRPQVTRYLKRIEQPTE